MERRAEEFTVVPWKTYDVASTRVHVHEGDITKMNVDVIVNAANGCLVHGGGVAGAIARAAAPEFTQECNIFIIECGEIYHGDGVMTSSGRLPCPKVFHVVGPMWYHFANKNDYLDILHQAFTSCLMARKYYSSIAIPSVSSGIYGVPSELVAQTMCEAVTKFCHGDAHQSRLRDIHLVDINTAMVKLLQENFELQSGTSEETARNLHGWPAYLVGSLE
ncbi:O-acetyl-ADP-ribose deacetylase [Lamellibrachia satsuma]|nr:O-acetyl-ADP-ribose deacetylase [Lamellibrachia satsuma]